ncbi:hypothetical protein scyTo_0019767 [Scyliorhinus torazame]|uniref:Butyrophilin subfamily 1 member A1-like n=1 Tax=Scyliorhinus torazame TaxID=75743 RepID=A0A401PQR4_SCYTO|nr:hypothetical protein [Scyliorhinus torazame]
MLEKFYVQVPDEPIIVTVGEDVVLECQLVPVKHLDNLEIRWFKSDSASPVHLNSNGQDRPDAQGKAYKGRTELFKDKFPHGNASLKLKKIKTSDEGNYTCFINLQTYQAEAVLNLKVEDEFFPKVNIWLIIFWVVAGLVITSVAVDVMMHRKEDKKIEELQRFCTLEGYDEVKIDYVSVTLDVETANPWLEVSDDLKSLRRTQTGRGLPDTGKKFTYWSCALGSEGFTSGRHYWEVEVTGNQFWNLGVAAESVERKGWVRLNLDTGFWTIGRIEKLIYVNYFPRSTIYISQIPGKVGVYLNYESGTISFFSVDTKSRLYTFTGNKFTEKLYPFFETWGENRLLRICSSSEPDL